MFRQGVLGVTRSCGGNKNLFLSVLELLIPFVKLVQVFPVWDKQVFLKRHVSSYPSPNQQFSW